MFKKILEKDSLVVSAPYLKSGGMFSIIVLVTVIIIMQITSQSLLKVEAQIHHLQDVSRKKDQTMSALYRELGYGGMIHDFKNYVLRRDHAYKIQFEESYERLKTVLEGHLKEDFVTQAEKKAVLAIMATIEKYHDKIPIVERAHIENLPQGEIDELVKVDDSLAMAAIQSLNSIIIHEEEKSYREIEHIEHVALYLKVAKVGGVFVLIMFWWLRNSFMIVIANYHNMQDKAEKRLRAIVSNTLEGMIAANEEGIIEEYNEACEKMFGWTQEEAIGQNLSMLMTGPHKYAHAGYLEAYLNGKKPGLIGIPREFKVVKKDGTIFYVEVSLSVYFANDKRYFTAILRDLTERKNKDRELTEIVDAIPSMITFLDKDLCYKFANKTYIEFWGRDAKDIIGRTVKELFPENTYEKVEPFFKRALSGQTVDYEMSLPIMNDEKHFHNMYIPRFDMHGNLIGILAVVHDITERKERELALARYKGQTQILVQAIEASQVGITLADATKKDAPLVFVNKAFEKITGYDRQDILGQNCRFLQGKKTDKRDVRTIREALKKNIPVNQDILNYRKDGTPFWNSLQIAPVYGENGELKAYVGTQIDITYLKRMQSALIQERDFTRYIIDFTPSLVIGLDPEGKVLFANKSALNVLKSDEKEVLGSNWWQKYLKLEEDKDQDGQIDHILQDFQNNGDAKNHEMTILDKDGGEHLISWTSLNQFDERGDLTQIIGAGTDLTQERKRAQEERERHKLESLGIMAGGIAHELNNALLPILLLAEDFKEKNADADEETKRNLQTVIDYALHGKDIVSDVLLYSRQSERDTEKYEVEELLNHAINFGAQVLPKEVSVKKRLAKAVKGQHIIVNRTGFEQVISNMCMNASHAMDGQGTIQLTLSKTEIKAETETLEAGSYLVIMITDTGSGIPEDVLPKIFDPFYTTKSEGQGTGLGLSVVYGLMRDWRGDIVIESTSEQGTVFKLFLPLVS